MEAYTALQTGAFPHAVVIVSLWQWQRQGAVE